MKKINVGLIGLGTVGNGVYRTIRDNGSLISERNNIQINLKKICDINTAILKEKTEGLELTDKWKDIVEDPEIDIVVELIGGLEPAKSIILAALRNGKNVVTANKKLLAEDGGEIFKAADETGLRIGFEASVGGGIPCILALRYGLAANRIKSVMGILNGTTNYILSMMEDSGISFSRALKEAQEKGFAEADPTFDIEGYDAGHKISILAMLAFGKKIDFKSIPMEGISKINKIDIKYAREMGYVIKLLGIAKLVNDCVDVRVHLTMLPDKHPLSSVRLENNAVMFDCDKTGPITLYGKGAGGDPTSSAIVSDILHISEITARGPVFRFSENETKYLLPGERISRYYLRIHTEDRPGILSRISGVLGNFEISISSVIQEEVHDGHVPLIILTHEAQEEAMFSALKEIKKFQFVHGDVMLIRVEDTFNSGEQK